MNGGRRRRWWTRNSGFWNPSALYTLSLAACDYDDPGGIWGASFERSMARLPNATEVLAVYGLAWGLVIFVSSPLYHARSIGLVLVDDPASRRKVRRFIILLALALASLSATPLGDWIIEDLHRVDRSFGSMVRTTLLWLIPIPFIRGLAIFYAGLLIRVRRTDIVSYASIISTGAGISLVFLLLPTPFIQENPIWLPILTIHASTVTEFCIAFIGYHRFGRPLLARMTRSSNINVNHDRGSRLKWAQIVRFFWPLAVIILAQEASRPLINVYIARGSNGTEALAVLTVAYVLGQFPYRWLNDIRNIASAFQDEPDSLRHLWRFALACGGVSLCMMLILFWTPIRDYILQTLMTLDADFAARCRVPLMLYAFFSPIVIVRAYYQGTALIEKRTHIMAACAPFRFGAIWLTLITLPIFAIQGATLGVAALTAGFFIEAICLWWGVRGRRLYPIPVRLAARGTNSL